MRHTRQGMSLVELMVAMSIATAVVGVLAAVVTRVMATNATVHDHLQSVVTLGRLGEQFRRDAHAASSATIEDAKDRPARITFQIGPQRTIMYEVTPDGLKRLVVGNGNAEHRDLFVLPGMKLLGWTRDADSQLVSLHLARLARPQSSDPTERGRFAIVAALSHAQAAVAANRGETQP